MWKDVQRDTYASIYAISGVKLQSFAYASVIASYNYAFPGKHILSEFTFS
jgi:hypothetical protein